ncbi:MAG: DUF4426 domain-containing protein [Sedimenticola sp.]|jgi:hypothetical protein|nr:MAG: DUF4426 domain-containing protein [Sedimenticola sp.]
MAIFPRILMLLALLAPLQLLAENITQADGYTIHHNALPVTTLSPEIATTYGLVRSKFRGLLNISVIKDVANTTGQPVAASVEAYATNLIGQRKDIALKEIREGEAIYYIGDFPITDQESLEFYLEVKPEGHSTPLKARLTQQFFID